MLHETIISNLRKIMADKSLTQETLAKYAATSPSQFSKILNGSVRLSLDQLSKIATQLSMREIDLITYPEIYVSQKETKDENVEVVLQMRLKKDKKDQVLSLVFGENNLEILNK